VTGLDLVDRRGPDYGRLAHDRKIALLQEPLGRVLDVGCAEGANAGALRAHGATELVGIDVDEGFVVRARERYDEVVHGSVPEDVPWAADSFDTILAYDVLEHLYDPWSAARGLAELLKPGGQLHISLPNARSKKLWLPLLLHGTFNYEPDGIMDVTHLRFFARRDATALAESAGLEVTSVDHAPPETRKRKLASTLTAGHAMEFLTIQWYIRAKKPLKSL
jgi:2-polyprenyl-3-methyl-5-hydroxy-6-metoxy-1,4-benzoquinol methylase